MIYTMIENSLFESTAKFDSSLTELFNEFNGTKFESTAKFDSSLTGTL